MDAALLEGVSQAIAMGLKMIPTVGPFVSAFFGILWGAIFSGGNTAQSMNSLFEGVQRLIQQQLEAFIQDQARAYNSTAVSMASAYNLSVENFRKNPSGESQSIVVARFESLRMHLKLMLNLFSTPTARTCTILSYGFALSMYTSLLKEMVLAGEDCGYSRREIEELKTDLNFQLSFAYKQHFYDTFAQINTDLMSMPWSQQMAALQTLAVNLSALTGGLMLSHNEWCSPYDAPALMPSDEEDPNFDICDWVKNPKASYVLNLRGLEIFDNHTIFQNAVQYLSQAFLNGRPVVQLQLHSPVKVRVGRFISQSRMEVSFKVLALFHKDQYTHYKVSIVKDDTLAPVASFHTSDTQNICTLPWFRLYTTSPGAYYFFDNKLEMQYGVVRRPARFQVEARVPYSVLMEQDTVNRHLAVGFVGLEIGPV